MHHEYCRLDIYCGILVIPVINLSNLKCDRNLFVLASLLVTVQNILMNDI